MAVTHSKAAREAMDRAVRAQAAMPAKTHKVIAYIACASGHKAVVADVREGDDVRAIVMDREQGKHGGGVVYLAHERQEDALFARSAMQGATREDFIRQRVSMLQTTAQPRLADAIRNNMEGEWLMDRLNVQQADQGYFRWSNEPRPHDWTVDPTPTPFMQRAMSRKEAEGLYGTSMAEMVQQATRGADFERKLEQVRKDQEELCGIKVGIDPAVGCDDLTLHAVQANGRIHINTGRRAGKTALMDVIIGMAPAARAGKSIEEIMREACERLWGSTPKMPAQDPSAARDEIAMARGSCKPQNKPHKDEKPANPYPPSHPKAAPAGLLAVSAMEARMGNRWSA